MKFSRRMINLQREQLLLLLISLLSLSFNTIHLNREGYGNLYYAAGVKSMLESWHNFFFLAYDPSGFVTIDKPPLGFWLQAISAKLLGFHGWTLILPQIIASLLSVLILYSLVSRVFGANSGLISSLMLAVTPIFVATARNNTIDSLLVFAVLLAAWMLFKASETTKSLRWLMASALMIGFGFNIKMMEAYLVLPAFSLLWFTEHSLSWRQKLKHISLAGIIISVVSLGWAFIVDLTPVNQRPYIGSTKHNSVLELMLQHNAADRFNGVNNPFRLFTSDLAGQISWLLPFAVLSGAFILWRAPLLRPALLNLQQRTVLFWLAWLIPMGVSFGLATLFHRYYTVMMAPAIAALAGIGLVRLYEATVHRRRSGWILITAIPITAIFAIIISWSYAAIRPELTLIISGLTIIALLALCGLLLLRNVSKASYRITAITACILTLLAGPIIWSATPAVFGAAGSDPVAGPELINRSAASPESLEDEKLTDYLLAHYVKGSFLLATLSAATSSPFILDTGLPVLTLGGYSGNDPILSKGSLQLLAQKGAVQYFLVSKPKMFDKNKTYTEWILNNCQEVHIPNSTATSTKASVALYQYTGLNIIH
jgi:4-amino-4-deoxy-L-arabinose transferase-like glycosyltransferase